MQGKNYYHKRPENLISGFENILETYKILITAKEFQKMTIFIIWVGLVSTSMQDLYIENQERFGFIYLPSKIEK